MDTAQRKRGMMMLTWFELTEFIRTRMWQDTGFGGGGGTPGADMVAMLGVPEVYRHVLHYMHGLETAEKAISEIAAIAETENIKRTARKHSLPVLCRMVIKAAGDYAAIREIETSVQTDCNVQRAVG